MRRASILAFAVVLLAACGPKPQPPPPPTFGLDAKGGVTLSNDPTKLEGLGAQVLLDTGPVSLTGAKVSAPTKGHDALGDYTEARATGTVGGLSITLALRVRSLGEATATITVVNGTGAAVQLDGFGLGPGTVSGTSFEGLLVDGYQSWSSTYYGEIGDLGTDTEASFGNIGDDAVTSSVDDRVSWWVSLLHSKGEDLVTGALTAHAWKTRVLVYDDRGALTLHVVSGGTGPGVTLAPGASATSEIFYFEQDADPVHALRDYGLSVALLDPPVTPPYVPVGWNSWNTLFANVTETDVLDNAAAIGKVAPGYGANDVQVDDGWEKAWGDWQANASFPSGMAGLASQISATGGRAPGVWMAPFLAATSAPVATAHPDWLLQGANGKPIVFPEPVGDTYVIDTSNPDADAWVVAQVQSMLDAGYRYLKLDFLFAGAADGVRADPTMTGVAAYRHTMKEILAAATKVNAYVLACGAPILPTAGVAHGIRTSSDIAFAALGYDFSGVKNVARNTSLRFFVNEFLASDPDAPRIHGLSPDEQRTTLTAALMTGRIFALGDDLTAIGPDEKALLAQIPKTPAFMALATGPVGWGVTPIDLLGAPITDPKDTTTFFLDPRYPVSTMWASPGPDGGTLVAVFDWTAAAQSRQVDLTGHGGWRPGRKVYDAWTGDPVTATGGQVKVNLAAHGSVLFWVH